jgi:hypothetical protein
MTDEEYTEIIAKMDTLLADADAFTPPQVDVIQQFLNNGYCICPELECREWHDTWDEWTAHECV